MRAPEEHRMPRDCTTLMPNIHPSACASTYLQSRTEPELAAMALVALRAAMAHTSDVTSGRIKAKTYPNRQKQRRDVVNASR